jgi:hypothetical protein
MVVKIKEMVTVIARNIAQQQQIKKTKNNSNHHNILKVTKIDWIIFNKTNIMVKKQTSTTSNSKKDDKKTDGKLGTCKEVHARHILCEKQSKILEIEKILHDKWF